MAATTVAPAAAAKAKAPVALVPFVRASVEHIEPFTDVTTPSLGATSVTLGPYDVPAYGFVRGVYLQVDALSGSGTATVVAAEDAPWSVIQEFQYLDVNGAPVVGPIAGYDLYLINKYGGYFYIADPKLLPYYSAPVVGANASGNFSFIIRVPIEVCGRDALGALPNQNASSTYKCRLIVAPSSSVYTTAPTTPPTVRFRFFLDAWAQPEATNEQGAMNAVTPPANGTTQYWTKTQFTNQNGAVTLRLPRVGNYIRNLILIARDAGNGTRATGLTDFPDPMSYYYDTRLLKNFSKGMWRNEMARKFGFISQTAEAAGGPDNGVFVEDFTHEFMGRAGYELRDLYLPTSQSTRLEFQGVFAANTNVSVLTNDVSPAADIFVG